MSGAIRLFLHVP